MPQNESPLSRNSLVHALAVWLAANGYMVGTCLDEDEHQKPPPLNGFKPEVYAMKNRQDFSRWYANEKSLLDGALRRGRGERES